jgi:hypothetical protein
MDPDAKVWWAESDAIPGLSTEAATPEQLDDNVRVIAPDLLRLNLGCRIVKQAKASHEVWSSPMSDRHFSIPANLSRHRLADQILSQAGLPKAF